MTTDEFMELMIILKEIHTTMTHVARVMDRVAVKLDLPASPAAAKKPA